MQEINWFEEIFLSLEMWGYIGVMGIIIIGILLAKKEPMIGAFWAIVELLFMARYIELVDATPEYWWHIMILLMGVLMICAFPIYKRR